MKSTRSRQSLRSKRENIEAADAVDGTSEIKKRKVNPSDSPRRSTRSNDVAKADVEQVKSKRNLNSVAEGASLVSHDSDSTNTQKSPQKLKRTHTATKLDATQTKSKPSKAKPSDDTQNGPSSHVPLTENIRAAHACHNAIEQVLAANYVDVQKRLKLLYPAKCIQSLLTCHKEHARNLDMTMSDNITTAHTFLKNHQPLMFMHVILMDVLSGKFPGRNLMPLFELIVCINEPALGEYSVANVIDMAIFTITRIMERFPPCWLAANQEYRTFLKEKGKHLITGAENFSANHTLFEDLINGVESVIHAPVKRTAKKLVDVSGNSSLFNDSLLNDSQDLQCFSKWELKHTQKYSFDMLPRDQKIHRIFAALSLYVILFEADLATWTLRNIEKPSNRIFDRQKGPLIGCVLWTDNEPNQVNYTIKNILKLFVDYVSIDFPNDETHVLSRLVNLIFNVFDLSAFRVNRNDVRVDYPQPVDEKNYFCDAFIKIIFDSNSCCIDLWFKIIKTTLHPKLKLCLINALLTKIEHKPIALHPEKIYRCVRTLEMNFDDIFDKTNSQNNNVVKPKDTAVRANAAADSKYPFMQKVNKRVSSEMSYEQSAELYLIALRAYMDIFHIDEFQDCWESYDQYAAERGLALERCREERRAMKNETVEPYDFDRMKKMQKTPFGKRIKDLGEHGHIHRLDVMYEVDGIRFLPKVDIKKYRNDAKHVDLIANQMPKLRSKFGAFLPASKQSK